MLLPAVVSPIVLVVALFWAIIIAHDVVVVPDAAVAFVAVATTAVQFTLLNYVQHLWAHFLDPATDLRSPPNSTQTTTHSPFARSILLKIPQAENKINYYSYKKLSLKDEL